MERTRLHLVAPPGPAADVARLLARRQVGLGMLPLAVDGRPPERAARAVVEAAFAAGVRVVDTADTYGLGTETVGYAERCLAPLLTERRRPEGLVVATKGGLVLEADGSRSRCARPDNLRRACEASLRRLGVEAIDLYQLHHVDPAVPLAESLGALVELAERGLVRSIGVSNVSVGQAELARDAAGDWLAAVQQRLTPSQNPGIDVLRWAHRRRRAYLAWGVFGGMRAAAALADRLPGAREVARTRGVSAHRVVVAWALAQGPGVLPLVGARTPRSIADSTGALELDLTAAELALITA